MTTDQLLDIIKAYKQYETTGQTSERNFAKWLYDKHYKPEPVSASGLELDRKISYLLQRIGRLSRYFSKRSFTPLDISSIEEFTLLNTIYNNPKISKNSLYQQCVIELSTGTQIVKRFIDKRLVVEMPSKEDKRVTLLHLTKAGKDLRESAFTAMIEEVIFKNAALIKQDKEQLVVHLQKINAHLTEKFLEEN
jgi:DNA-binding MarR family transcriptional regulator